MLQIVLKRLLDLPGKPGVVNDQINFFIDREGTVIKVRAAYGRPHAIHNHGFSVHESRLIFVDFNASQQEIAKAATAGRRGRCDVAFCRSEDHYLHTPFRRINQRRFDPIIREKIGVRDVNALLRRCNRQQE